MQIPLYLIPSLPNSPKDVGAVVMKGLEDKSGWVIAESCEVIFSVFDDNFEDVVQHLKMLPRLQQFHHYLASNVQRESYFAKFDRWLHLEKIPRYKGN
jgi:hypothetical protein